MSAITAWFDQQHVNFAALVTSAAVLVIAALAITLVKRLLRNWLSSVETRIQLSGATVSAMIRIVSIGLWLIAALLILDAWGIALAGVWGLLVSGIAVIGVGFLATWAIISNFTASLFLTIWRPFRLGDTVVILPENTAGRVTQHNLMFTVLREQDGSVVNVPNNLFFQKMFRVVSGG
jgi:small-conductance mechanosensitive channel